MLFIIGSMITISQILLVLTIFVRTTLTSIDWKGVDAKINSVIAEGHFSGCVLGVFTQNTTIFKKAYGTIVPKWGMYAPAVDLDTYFDANYITQVIGINSQLMRLSDLGKIDVNDKVIKHHLSFNNKGKGSITIKNLLLHNSGLPPTISEPFGANEHELLKKIDELKLEYAIDSKFEYSELGSIVLGQIIEKVSKESLQTAITRILVDSGLFKTKYKVNVSTYEIAPSSYNRGAVRGTPANKIAAFMGGVAGNAGLFTTLDNIGTYMQLMLNKGKMPLSLRVFTEAVVDLFTTKVSIKNYTNTRALGWDTAPLVDPPCGHKFSKNSFGFSDPMGSYLWADKDKNISIVLLAANGYPYSSNINHASAQGSISDEIMTAIGY